MDESELARSTARDLRAHVAACTEDLAARIDRICEVPAAATGGAFAPDFLDRLRDECDGTGHRALDEWAAALQRALPNVEFGTALVSACSTVAASFLAVRPGAADAALFLAHRGRSLDRVCERAADDVRKPFAPSRLVERSEVVTSLLASLHARDAATCDHSQAVGSWAERVAAAFGMTEAEQEFIGLGGTLHDIGKLAMPAAILLKPSSLDAEEWEVMRRHSAVGASILEAIPSLRACAAIVRGHHERVDGTGYPDGKSGDEIPLACRIVSVADAFHAMISNRPYRAAMPAAEALATLVEGRGTHWDPKVVDVMLEIVRPSTVHEALRSVRGGSPR